MTAEIAIMNKGGIALAADSAGTLPFPRGKPGAKIYNSENKVFMLSKYQPVGAMVYGSSGFSGVPWETIVKEYRRRLKTKAFVRLDGYVRDFLTFLTVDSGLFSDKEQQRYVARKVRACFTDLREEIDRLVRDFIQTGGKATEAQIQGIAKDVITQVWRIFNDKKRLPCLEGQSQAQIIKKHKEIVEGERRAAFEQIPFDALAETKLHELAANLFLKKIIRRDHAFSGLVIAGFGVGEHYPVISAFVIDGLVDGKLRYLIENTVAVTDDNTAFIIPFAQKEMVHTFMEGIDPQYNEYLNAYLQELFNKLPEEIVNLLADKTQTGKLALTKKLKESCGKLLHDLENVTDSYRQEHHVRPVLDAVTILPKDELAAMAESLVNLTSFKRRISMDAETVGGPIDVALISKGDGFIWVKRKHYFDPKLNPGFFANYYRDCEEGEKSGQDKGI